MFKDKLKELRVKKGLTQKELGEKVFVSRSAICKWEIGNGYPSDVNLQTLCKFFDVTEEWLLDRNDYKEMIVFSKTKFKKFIWIATLIVGFLSLGLSFWPCISNVPPFSSLMREYQSIFMMLFVEDALLRVLIILSYIIIINLILITIFDILIIKNKIKKNNKFIQSLSSIIYGKNHNQNRTNFIFIISIITIWILFNIIVQLSYQIMWFS